MAKIIYISPRTRVQALMKLGMCEAKAQDEVIKILNRLHNHEVLKKYPHLINLKEDK